MSTLTPREIVAELNKFVVGQEPVSYTHLSFSSGAGSDPGDGAEDFASVSEGASLFCCSDVERLLVASSADPVTGHRMANMSSRAGIEGVCMFSGGRLTPGRYFRVRARSWRKRATSA